MRHAPSHHLCHHLSMAAPGRLVQRTAGSLHQQSQQKRHRQEEKPGNGCGGYGAGQAEALHRAAVVQMLAASCSQHQCSTRRLHPTLPVRHAEVAASSTGCWMLGAAHLVCCCHLRTTLHEQRCHVPVAHLGGVDQRRGGPHQPLHSTHNNMSQTGRCTGSCVGFWAW